MKSAQSQFPLVTQPKRMISQTGGSVEERIAEEHESSNAQIRTMLDEQRKTIIAEYGEKVLHHEILAAQAEQDRRILQEELLRQQQDFREVHQQDLMKMKELQKFQNSTFDEFTKQKFIEDNIHWGKNSWRQLSLIGDETVINLQRTKVYVFSDSVLCLGKILQHPDSTEAWKNRIAGAMSEKSYRDYDGINGEPTEFECNIFPGFTTLQLCGKVTDLLSRLGETPETFTGRILFMSMFNDMTCDKKGNEEECLANARVVSIFAKRFGIGQWSFIGPGSEKK